MAVHLTSPARGRGDADPTATAVDLLSPEQIEDRLTATSVAFLPLGSLEFHGPHLPVGLDALTARGICLRAAERAGGVVLPTVHHAVGGEHERYPWTLMSQSADAIETLLTETLSRLSELGVRRSVLLSGHFAGEQQQLITRVADGWNARGAQMTVVARTLGQAPESPVAPDHAGMFESLLLYAMAPQLVDLTALPDVESHPAPSGEDPYGQDRHRADHPLHGIFGADPRRLPVERADSLLEYMVQWVAELASSVTAATAH